MAQPLLGVRQVFLARFRAVMSRMIARTRSSSP